MLNYSRMLELTPEPGREIDWPEIWKLCPDRMSKLDSCQQDPKYHAEGDVGTHTRMVCEALMTDFEWSICCSPEERFVLFWAAVFHDVGKPATTKVEDDGRITSKGHSRVGAQIARELLWQGEVPYALREAICGIILNHQKPFHLLDKSDPTSAMIELSWKANVRFLAIHARADILGRSCEDQESLLDNIAYFRILATDVGCLDAPYTFANDASRIEYFTKRDRSHHYTAYEDFRCTVTMMSGMSGSGKNTWIEQNCADLPVVSLDDIRKEMGINPATGNVGPALQEAQHRMRTMMAAGQDFVLNNTCIDTNARQRWLGLCYDYNARIRTVYIEKSPSDLFRQNRERPFNEVVPDAYLKKQASKFSPPTLLEAHETIFDVPGPTNEFDILSSTAAMK